MKRNKEKKQKLVGYDKITNNYITDIKENKIVIKIPRSEIEKEEDLIPTLNIGLMFGLHQINIKNIDITMRENKNGYEIVIEQ